MRQMLGLAAFSLFSFAFGVALGMVLAYDFR